MLSNTMTLAAATRCGPGLLGVRTPVAFPAPAGANHARTQILATAASPLVSQRGLAISKNRKHNVHETQIGVGYGVMGPHPEREPA
jgi:hypothetical protein